MRAAHGPARADATPMEANPRSSVDSLAVDGRTRRTEHTARSKRATLAPSSGLQWPSHAELRRPPRERPRARRPVNAGVHLEAARARRRRRRNARARAAHSAAPRAARRAAQRGMLGARRWLHHQPRPVGASLERGDARSASRDQPHRRRRRAARPAAPSRVGSRAPSAT